MEVQNIQVQNATQKPVFMFKGHEISIGKKISPLKAIIYGDNGIGKTTFAASAKNPIIVDLEGNCNHIEAPKQRITSLDELEELLNALMAQDHDYKTLVIDSLDSLEVLISEKISNICPCWIRTICIKQLLYWLCYNFVVSSRYRSWYIY